MSFEKSLKSWFTCGDWSKDLPLNVWFFYIWVSIYRYCYDCLLIWWMRRRWSIRNQSQSSCDQCVHCQVMEARLHFTSLLGDEGLLVGDQRRMRPSSDHQIFINFERIGTLQHLKLVTLTIFKMKKWVNSCVTSAARII